MSRFLTHPLVAFLQFVGSFYVLYFSGLLDAVATYHAAHILMNIHFLLSGYLFYWVVIGIDPSPRQVQPLIKVAMVFAALPFHAFFGVILMSQNTVIAEQWFRSLALPWNSDLLADQRTGGAIAWAAGEVPLVIVLIALFSSGRVTTSASPGGSTVVRIATTTPNCRSTTRCWPDWRDDPAPPPTRVPTPNAEVPAARRTDMTRPLRLVTTSAVSARASDI